MTVLAIRPLEPSDRDAVLALAGSLAEWFNEAGLSQMGQDLAHPAGFIAIERGRVNGFITWRRIDATAGDLTWLGVVRDLHRDGVGTSLLRVLTAHLQALGVERLEVATVGDSLDYEPACTDPGVLPGPRVPRPPGVDRAFYGDDRERYDRLVLGLDLAAR